MQLQTRKKQKYLLVQISVKNVFCWAIIWTLLRFTMDHLCNIYKFCLSNIDF